MLNLRLRRVLGVLIPLATGVAFTWLLDLAGVEAPGSPRFTLPLLIVATTGLAGTVGGWLLRSWWAIALVPVTLVVGMALAALVRTGTITIAEGAPQEVVPLAVLLLIALLVPTAVGASIGG